MPRLFMKVKSFFQEYRILIRSVPALITTLFVLSVVGMNLLANKSIDTHLDWLALDCGIIFSWLSFLTMDILTKRFGPKASTMISIFALGINLLLALIFFIAAIIPGFWGESFVEGSEEVINTALNNTFRGTWYIILGSSVAFIISAIVNNVLNWVIGKAFKRKPNSFLAFATRAYVSTMIAQFVDNLVFALLVSRIFFGWSFVQCITCAASGALLELLFEVVFSPLGYKISKNLEKNNIGKEYFDFLESKKGEIK